MDRRTLLAALAGAPLAAMAARVYAGRPTNMKDIALLEKNWMSFLPAGAKVPSATEKLVLSKDEWRKRLPLGAYKVLRDEATERAGSSPLDREKREGVFACAGCGLPVFSSAMKFDSGTGWPSFFTTIPGAFVTKTDYLIVFPRTEYHCARCGGHHGHVFDDGPAPTGKRFCNNGLALTFLPKA